jgi:hypothetical protein
MSLQAAQELLLGLAEEALSGRSGDVVRLEAPEWPPLPPSLRRDLDGRQRLYAAKHRAVRHRRAAVGRGAAGTAAARRAGGAAPGRRHGAGGTEPWLQARRYLSALAGGLARRNGWTIAEHAGDRAPDKTQRLLSRAVWDTAAAMSVVRRFAVAGLQEAVRRSGRRGGLAIGALDGTGQEKVRNVRGLAQVRTPFGLGLRHAGADPRRCTGDPVIR